MALKKLDYEEYQLTFQSPMLDVTTTVVPVVDIWPYVDAVPISDLEGAELSDGLVKHVYMHPSGQFEHVLVSTLNPEIFLVIILDLLTVKICGHYLLDLLNLYGEE